MAGLNSGLRAGEEEPFDPLMSKAANHSDISVPRNATLYKSPRISYGVFQYRFCISSSTKNCLSLLVSPPAG
jgi:hypothetical protein